MHGALKRSMVVLGVLALGLVAALHAAAGPGPPGGAYKVTPLVSDIPGVAPSTDPDLVNAWGLARSATSPWWVADNGPDERASRRSTTAAARNILSVRRPRRPDRRRLLGHRRQVPDRDDSDPTALGPAKFIFATENGDIRAWRAGSTALVAARRASPPARCSRASRSRQRRRAARCSTRPTSTTGASTSSTALAARHAARRVRRPEAAARLRAVRDPDDRRPASSSRTRSRTRRPRRRGRTARASASSTSTTCRRTLRRRGSRSAAQLNAPWGLAMAPAGLRRASAATCSSATSATARSTPTRRTIRTGAGITPARCARQRRQPLAIDGLWALEFGNTGSNGDPDTLFFTAGPNDESDGLFGTIKPG